MSSVFYFPKYGLWAPSRVQISESESMVQTEIGPGSKKAMQRSKGRVC